MNRVFHYFHHPFWGSLIFGNTHIKYFCINTIHCRKIYHKDSVDGRNTAKAPENSMIIHSGYSPCQLGAGDSSQIQEPYEASVQLHWYGGGEEGCFGTGEGKHIPTMYRLNVDRHDHHLHYSYGASESPRSTATRWGHKVGAGNMFIVLKLYLLYIFLYYMWKLIPFLGGLFALLGSIIIPSLLLKKNPANKNTTSVIVCLFSCWILSNHKNVTILPPPKKKKTTPKPFDPPWPDPVPTLRTLQASRPTQIMQISGGETLKNPKFSHWNHTQK